MFMLCHPDGFLYKDAALCFHAMALSKRHIVFVCVITELVIIQLNHIAC
jgi:hypothetical protein